MSVSSASLYPASELERDRWILERRGRREALDPLKPYAYFVEDEISATGEIVPVATIFLTNRECPWRCVMCDLWRNTLPTAVPTGAIPSQIDFALARLPAARQLKLYNSGSFFDPRAIAVEDHGAIAERANGFERLIVENHPALTGESLLRFRDELKCDFEVAIGLETVHPEILPRLNKRMTLEMFSRAADFLREHEVDLRVFILVQPPFMAPADALHWAKRSLDFAFECEATAATLIPTRGGNGAMEELALQGEFLPPRLEVVEAAVEYGMARERGRVFADVWNIENIPSCAKCRAPRIARLRAMNLSQAILPCVSCEYCGSH